MQTIERCRSCACLLGSIERSGGVTICEACELRASAESYDRDAQHFRDNARLMRETDSVATVQDVNAAYAYAGAASEHARQCERRADILENAARCAEAESGETCRTLRNGYDRSKDPESHRFRPMLATEAKRLIPGQRVWFLAVDGTARAVTINGAPKTWKRDATRVEVPVKYGLYEYNRFTARSDGTMDRLLVRCDDNGDGLY